MSQDKAKEPKDSSETRKRILLGVLVLVMLGVFYFQFFSGDEATPNQTTAGGSPATKPSPTPTPRPVRPGEKPETIITQPLVFAWFDRSISGDGTGRNIFVYPTPTPEPPPRPLPPQRPPPPPPVLLSSINPSGIIAKTGDTSLAIYGDKFPQDAQVFLDGRPYETKIISQTEIRVQVPGDAIKASGNLGVQVRSKSDATLFSNQLALNVAEPPAPAYRFIGLITNKNGAMAVLKSQADESDVINVRRGEKFGTHWRVVNITSQKIDIEDMNLKIVHTINFTGENG